MLTHVDSCFRAIPLSDAIRSRVRTISMRELTLRSVMEWASSAFRKLRNNAPRTVASSGHPLEEYAPQLQRSATDEAKPAILAVMGHREDLKAPIQGLRLVGYACAFMFRSAVPFGTRAARGYLSRLVTPPSFTSDCIPESLTHAN